MGRWRRWACARGWCDARRLALILLLCSGAATRGEWLAGPPTLTIRVDQPAPADSVRGLVHLRGQAADPTGEAPLTPDDVVVLLARAPPVSRGHPLLLAERWRPGRAIVELDRETCTFAPDPYMPRVVARAADGRMAADTRRIAVERCPGAPLAVSRQDPLRAPSHAWRDGTTSRHWWSTI